MERDSKDEEPKAEVAKPELAEFAVALDSCLAPNLTPAQKRAKLLDLPNRYYENAARRLLEKKPKPARHTREDTDMEAEEQDAAPVTQSQDAKEVLHLEKEVQTWDLMRRIFPLRYAESNSRPSSPIASRSVQAFKASDIYDFIRASPILRERHAVLQWLQSNAAARPDIDELSRELQQNADRDIIAHGWLHTRSQIKLRKSVTAWSQLLERQSPNVAKTHVNSQGAPLVTHLDPDAASRQERNLEPQDEYFERAIWLGCYEHLRRGSSLHTIREWCEERTELWRAVSMSAMLIPNAKEEPLTDIPASSMALWRRMCQALAREGGSDDYERAVYGALAGDVASVEQVSTCWDDFMFAWCNALLRGQVDAWILTNCPPDVASNLGQSFPSFDVAELRTGDETLEQGLVAKLESMSVIQQEALEPSKALQASVVAGTIEKHMYQQALVWTDEANEAQQSQLLPPLGSEHEIVDRQKYFHLDQREGLRIECHIYALMALVRQLDTLEKGVDLAWVPNWDDVQERIIAAYTGYLASVDLFDLIPLYCSILQPPQRYEVLSWNMIQGPDLMKRAARLQIIKRVGIDALSFVRVQARIMLEGLGAPDDAETVPHFSILLRSSPTTRYGRGIKGNFLGDDAAVAPEDERAIRALEWLLHVPVAWPVVLSVGVKMYKVFLRTTRLLALRKLMERVPLSVVLQIATGTDKTDRTLLDDLEFWAQQLEPGDQLDVSPSEVMADAKAYHALECLAKALDSLETIGSLMVLRSETPVEKLKEFWDGFSDAIKVSKRNMQPLLSNWLYTGSSERDEEFATIRQGYLPEAILGFISALHYAGTGATRDNLLDCMELASTVASPDSDLPAVFVKAGRMTELVQAFAAASKALAMQAGDKKAAKANGKKFRQRGWARDIWAVKQ